MSSFDLVVIGGGTAGLVTSAGAASLGLRVALVERDALGGDCLWTGCVPSKALIASARVAHDMRVADRYGLEPVSPAGGFGSVMDRLRRVRETVAVHDDPDRFRQLGIDVRFGSAEVVGPHTVVVDGASLEAKHVVIATGARPSVPPIPGLEDAGYLTHHTVFDLDEAPRHIGILGGGAIGVEFAQALRRLGSEVTVFEALPRLLPRDDEAAASVLARVLEAEGVRILTGTPVARVEPGPGGTHRLCALQGDGEVAVDVDRILVATGRRPNGDGLGLETVGVAVDRGTVVVDRTLRTAVKSIWAAGDVVGGPQFTHVADYQAKLVLRNIVSPLKARADYSQVPSVTFTDPEVARVGLTAAEARDRFAKVQVYSYGLADLDRSIVDGHTEGFVEIITRNNGRIIGATIVARGAGELLPALVLAMRHRIPLKKLSHIVWAYPTVAEAVKRTADLYYREALQGTRGKWIRRLVRWLA